MMRRTRRRKRAALVLAVVSTGALGMGLLLLRAHLQPGSSSGVSGADHDNVNNSTTTTMNAPVVGSMFRRWQEDTTNDDENDDGLPKTEKRIVGGSDAGPNEYPTFVLSAGQAKCGGTLIHDDIVLTAAHCAGAFLDSGIYIGGILLDGSDGQLVGVSREIPHPSYDRDNDLNDVMLVQLEEPVTDTPKQELNFDENVPADGETVTVIGSGFVMEGGPFAATLQVVDVNIVDFDTCQNFFGNIVDDIMVCAGADARDSCQGDSGGPLLTANNVQVGVVSFGAGCAREGVPAAVYARVSAYEEFFAIGICEFSENPPDSCSELTSNSTTVPTVSNGHSVAPGSTTSIAPASTTAPSMAGPVPTASPNGEVPSSNAPGLSLAPSASPTTTASNPTISPSSQSPNMDRTNSNSPSVTATTQTIFPSTIAPNADGSVSSEPAALLPPSVADSDPTVSPSTTSPYAGSRAPATTLRPSEGPGSGVTSVPTSPTIVPASVNPSGNPGRVPVGNPTTRPTITPAPVTADPVPTQSESPTTILTSSQPSEVENPTSAPSVFRFGGGTPIPTHAPTTSRPTTGAPTIFRFGGGTSPPTDLVPRSPSPTTVPPYPSPTNRPTVMPPPSSPSIDVPTLIHSTYSPTVRPLQSTSPIDIPTLIFGLDEPTMSSPPSPPPFIDIPTLILGPDSPTLPAPPPISIPTLIYGTPRPTPKRMTIVPPIFLFSGPKPVFDESPKGPSPPAPSPGGPRPVLEYDFFRRRQTGGSGVSTVFSKGLSRERRGMHPSKGGMTTTATSQGTANGSPPKTMKEPCSKSKKTATGGATAAMRPMRMRIRRRKRAQQFYANIVVG